MTRPFHIPLVATLLCSTALSATAQVADTPVRNVVLYESGLAELTRETGDSDRIQLRVPLRDVNDILKSLLVRGSGISGARIVLDGSDPVGDTFARLPFPPEAVKDLPTLFETVPGIRITDGYAVTGEIVDVGEVCTDAVGCHMSLMVLGDDGKISNLVVKDGGSIQILDEGIVDNMVTGLRSLKAAAADTTRDITINLTGDSLAGGQMSYVVSAPAWKTSYRAISAPDGGVNLQGWAVIQNATGEDWSGVTLTLSSGSPVTLQSDLFGRDWRTREDVSSKTASADVADPQMAFRAVANGLGMMESDMAMAAPAPIVAGTVMSDSAVESRFALPGAQDIAAGKILSTPFLTDSLDASRVSRWRGDTNRTGSPDLVLVVKNDLPVRLPSGIVTLSDPDTGFVGDARMPIVAPGETVDVVYGTDQHIDVEQRNRSAENTVSVTVVRGMIRIAGVQTIETIYNMTLHAGESQKLLIDHPEADGWTTEARIGDVAVTSGLRKVDAAGQAWLRHEIALPEADGEAVETQLKIVSSRPTLQTVAFGTLDADAFLSWSGKADDPASKAFLAKAAKLSSDVNKTAEIVDAMREDLRVIEQDQARTRSNLSAAASGTAAHNRFMETLISLEDQIATNRTKEHDAVTALAVARAALDDHLAGGL